MPSLFINITQLLTTGEFTMLLAKQTLATDRQKALGGFVSLRIMAEKTFNKSVLSLLDTKSAIFRLFTLGFYRLCYLTRGIAPRLQTTDRNLEFAVYIVY